jgi:dolichol-phosphate mannosyltransferase
MGESDLRALTDAERGALPAHRVEVFAPRVHPHVVLIPVINEGERIRAQLSRMHERDLSVDVAIVDGGSTDGSLEADFLGAAGVRALIVKMGPGRLSAQLRIGFAWAIDEGYAGIVTIDGNGKDDIAAIPSFVRALDEGWDFVQGSRYISGGHAVNTPWDRTAAVRCLHAPILSLGARFRYTDTTNGFRAFSARFLLDPRVQPFRAVFDTYNLHYYLSVRASRLGFRVRELPVTRTYPSAGPVPSKIAGMRGRIEILKQALIAAAGGYDPEDAP